MNPRAALAFLGARYDVGLSCFNPNRGYTVTGNPSGQPGTFGPAPGHVESRSNLFTFPASGPTRRSTRTIPSASPCAETAG